MRLTILCVFVAALCFPCVAQTTANNDAERPGYSPVIVAKKQVLNQTGTVNPVTLYTPTEDADFRISAYMSTHSCEFKGSGFEFQLLLTWTDDSAEWVNQEIAALNCNNNHEPLYSSGTIFIHAKAGAPISVWVQAIAGASGSYDGYIVVEQE